VLGCPVGPQGRPGAALRRRVERGLAVYRRGAAPLLLLSGGGDGPVAEAEAMRAIARQAGIGEDALLIEPRSRSTNENARNTARLLRARGKTRVVLVSDRAHLPRAALLFRLAGLRVAGCAAAPPPSPRTEFRLALYELAALPWSLVRALWRITSAP
jgi:uncharacterized SAM-binding protein YcdF (DUF218 family)